MTTVAIYQHHGTRPRIICDAFEAGARKVGFRTWRARPDEYYSHDKADVAAFYGLRDGLLDIMKKYIADGRKTILADFGYWNRLEGGTYSGYHKLVVNGRHCTNYFQRHKHDSARFSRLGIEPLPVRKGGDHILLAGMSEKAAWVVGLKPEEWERSFVSVYAQEDANSGMDGRISLPVIYRPKPSWRNWTLIPGCVISRNDEQLQPLLDGAWAVVSHHSNVGTDALVRGCPVFQVEGAALPLAEDPMTEIIGAPYYPTQSERDQLLYDLAYTQWKPAEIESGKAWDHLIGEGLICG